jgi:hypothetical protein
MSNLPLRMRLGFDELSDANCFIGQLVTHSILYVHTYEDEEHIVDLLIPQDEERESALRSLMSSNGNWRPAGPSCGKNRNHGATCAALKRHRAIWKCIEQGCDFVEYVQDTNYITVSSFRVTGVRRRLHEQYLSSQPEIQEYKDRILGSFVPPYAALDVDATLAVWDNFSKKAMNEIQTGQPSRQRELERGNLPVRPVENILVASEKEDLLKVYKVANEMFCFLGGINFQDHPIADQRKLVELMRKMGQALKKGGDK